MLREYRWHYCFLLSQHLAQKNIQKIPHQMNLMDKVCNKGMKCERSTNSYMMVFLKKSTLKTLSPFGITYNYSLQVFNLLRLNLQTPHCKLTSAPGGQAGDLIGNSDCHPSDRTKRRHQETEMLRCACWAK